MDFVDVGLWVVQGLLGIAFLAAGAMKSLTPREKLMAQMSWVSRFPAYAPRAIGLAEVAGALGLVLPWATGILPELTPLAAGCLFILMAGAAKVHVDGHETPQVVAPAILGLLALVVAVGRAMPSA